MPANRNRFLWVALQASDICKLETQWEVEDAIKPENLTLPTELDDIYKKYAQEFKAKSETVGGQVAMRTLALLAHGTGSISKAALLVAIVAQTVDDRTADSRRKEMEANPDRIVHFCKDLVAVDEELGSVRFAHMAAYDFFKKYDEPARHALIAELSLAYLASPAFPDGRSLQHVRWFERDSLQAHLHDHPFLAFAARSWAGSVKKSSEESRARLVELFGRVCVSRKSTGVPSRDEEDRIALAFQVYLLTRRKPLMKGIRQEHVFSYFRLAGYLQTFHEKGWLDTSKTDDAGLTAMHWAIKSEVENEQPGESETCRVVATLIRCGANIEAKDKKGRTPLYYAAWLGRLDVVQLLLAKRAKVDAGGEECGTPLRAASHRDHATYPQHAEMTQVLLKAGASVNSQSDSGTPLHAVAWVGCVDCARLMFEKASWWKRPRRNVYGGHFGTALHAAAFNGHVEMVRLLLEKRFGVNKMHDTYGSTLAAAAAGCWEDEQDTTKFAEIFQLLIAHKVNVNAEGGLHVTALHAAAALGHRDLVEMLLDNDADSKVAGPAGTAYQAASDAGHETIVALFEEKRPGIALEESAIDVPVASEGEDAFKPQIKVWLALLRIALASHDVNRMKRNIQSGEAVFNRAIRKGQYKVLESLTRSAESIFAIVISLASEGDMAKKGGLPKDRKPRTFRRKVVDKRVGLLDCFKPDTATDTPAQFRLDRQLSTNQIDDVSKILDLLTQAAVRILESAFSKNNKRAIAILAQSWTRALYSVTDNGEWGKSMLATLLSNRAAQLRVFLADDETDGPDESERAKKKAELAARFHNAKKLAEVGVELLITALSGGQQYKPLATALANLWVQALEDVDALGSEYQNDILRLVTVFAARFQAAVNSSDTQRVRHLADAGVEIVQITALRKLERLTDLLAVVLTEKWTAAINKQMGEPIDQLVEQRRKQYRACITGRNYKEALALVAALTALLRTALSRGYEDVARKLSDIFVEESEWTFTNVDFPPLPTQIERQQRPRLMFVEASEREDLHQAQPELHFPRSDQLDFVDSLANLIFVAMEKDYSALLDPLLRMAFRVIRNASEDWQTHLGTTLRQRVEFARSPEKRSNTTRSPTDLHQELQQLNQSCSVVVSLLHLALNDLTKEVPPPPLLVEIGYVMLEVIRDQPTSEQATVVIEFLGSRQ